MKSTIELTVDAIRECLPILEAQLLAMDGKLVEMQTKRDTVRQYLDELKDALRAEESAQ